jgi:hypothetical protein
VSDPTPFIEREFTVDGQPVLCRFFQPEADGQDFACRFEIDWPEGQRQRRIFGIDPTQALLLAMEMAHVYLLMAREQQGRNVHWLDSASLGLPLMPNMRDLDPEGRH